MIKITYMQMLCAISIVWLCVRALIAVINKNIDIKRELQLILVYVCIVVIARFVFFPFSKVDGVIQPLVFDPEKALQFRINTVPFVHLFDYAVRREALLNLIGNTTMFIPVGIVWPCVFRKLDSHIKVLLAGTGFSLIIEILQLPFFDRVTDIDDLILNSAGYATGYCIYLICRETKKRLSLHIASESNSLSDNNR